MAREKLIDRLAKEHNVWIKMAKSLGCGSDEQANELVQQMYLKLCILGKNKYDAVIVNDQVNKMYVYNTIKNLFLDGFHLPSPKNHVEIMGTELVTYDEDLEEIFEQKESNFDNLINEIESIVTKWYWYDKKMWEIYFHKNMSMREISDQTKISLKSIFDTLSYAKKEVKKRTENLYKKYKDSK